MQRTDGLVQRRVASTVNNSGQDNYKTEDEPSTNGDYDSSKDTRFTLMEEVLLLGLKDKEVCRFFVILPLFCLCFGIIRVIHPFGMIAFPPVLEGAF